MSKALADISFADLLPASIAADPVMAAAAQTLDAELRKVDAAIDNVLIWSRIDELEEPLLSYLAWQLHVDYWQPDMSDEVKRAILKQSDILHQTKGTPGAVEAALALVVGNATLEEWFEYGGDPYHFRINVDLINQGMDMQTFSRMLDVIERYKNLRSIMETLHLYLTVRSSRYEAPALLAGETVTVYPYAITALAGSGIAYRAAGAYAVETITVYPQTT